MTSKRIFDIIFSVTFILLFSWLYLIIGLIILINYGLPIIYSAERVGYNKKTFICYKFRTMQNKKNIITKFGKLLRNSNLDELPQFYNVFLGDMSVVGPRPHDYEEDSFFSKKIDNYDKRFLVKPGITGFAAIYGNRGGTDLLQISRRVTLDLHYIDNYSFYLDLKIVLITIYLTLTRKNSI